MPKIVVGLFPDLNATQHVISHLREAGFQRADMTIRDAGNSRQDLARLVQQLAAEGVPGADLRGYEQGLRAGGLLVVLHTTDEGAPAAREIMLRFGQESTNMARGMAEREPELAREHGGTTRTLGAGEEVVLPVVAEEVRVGKRQVQTGNVRVQAHVSETPVEEQVRLREERIRVERRPTDRPADNTDMLANPNQTLELRTTAEEPVVAKQARVVEEVVVKKEAQERTETIRETVRRTDVDIERENER